MRRAYFVAVVVFASAIAHAEPTEDDLVTARHTFDRALKLEDTKKFDEALVQFRAVEVVKATPQVRFHVAYCLHKLGKLVDAAIELDKARVDAQALGPPGESVVAHAMQERNELYASTPRLSVKLPDGSRPRSMVLDGKETSLGDDPIPLDPGTHHLVVARVGLPPFERDVVLAERRPAMVAEILVGQASAFRVAPITIVAAGVTLATVAATVVTGVMQVSFASKLAGECGVTRDQCPLSAQGDIDTAGDLTTATNVLLVVSGALLAATAVAFFTTSFRSREKKIALSPLGLHVVF